MSVRILADRISHPYIRFYQYGLTAFTIHTQRGQAIRDRVKAAVRERDACGLFQAAMLARMVIDDGHIFMMDAPKRQCSRIQGSAGAPSGRVRNAYSSMDTKGSAAL